MEAGLAREDRLEDALGSMLEARFGITHATVQAELPGAHGGRDPHAAWAAAGGTREHGHGHDRPSRRAPGS